jgi:quercetin dioxygenase-like cupin family protein
MKENRAFQFIGEMPMFDKLLTEVLSLTDEDWTEYEGRKKRRGAASAVTDTIPLFYDVRQRIDSAILHKNYERFSAYVDEVVLAASEHLGEIKLQQSMLTRLKAGVVIPEHRDEGRVTKVTHRMHVAVITNSECIFTIGSEPKNLKPGQMWIIDNVGRTHSLRNDGTEDRVHLIVDATSI